MKILSIYLAVFCLTFNLYGQETSVHLSRGISGIYTKASPLQQKHSQGFGLGLRHSALLKEQLYLQTGLDLQALSSTNYLPLADGEYLGLPPYFFSVDVPFMLEKRIALVQKKKHPDHVSIYGGVNAAFVWHRGGKDHADHNPNSGLLQPGVSFGASWSKNLTNMVHFTVGPECKFLATGGQYSTWMGFYGIKLGWGLGQ